MIKRCIDDIETLYNSFPVKDLTFKDFRKKYLAATNPVKLRKDLVGVVRYRGMRRTQELVMARQKKQIDTVMSEK